MKSQDNNPRLVVIEGKDKGKIFPLKDGTMVIGRSKADIVIQDPRISRSHVTIEFDSKSGKILFTDLRSLNGTIINEELMEKGELKDGDKLQLGNTIFDCQIGVAEATIAAQPPQKKKKEKEKEAKKEIPEKNKTEDTSNDFKGTPSIQRVEPKLESSSISIPPEDSEKKKQTKAYAAKDQKVSKNKRVVILAAALVAIWFLSKMGSNSTSSDPLAERQRIQALQKDGKLAEAMQAAEKLAKENPEDANVQYLYADLAFNQNKLEDAINTLRKTHNLKDFPPLVHVRLAKAYNRGGLANETLEELKHVDEQLKGEPGKDKEFVTQTAILFSDTKVNPEKVLELARLLKTSLASDSTIGYKLEAGVLLDLKRTEEAVGVLEKGLLIDPKDELILERLSFAKLSNKDLPGALKTLQSWIDTSPKATKPLLVMAYLKFNEKEYLAALPFLRNVIQILANNTQDPDYSEALHLTGKIYQEQNQKTEAGQTFQKACALGFQESCAALQSLSSQAETKSNAPASLKEPEPATPSVPSTEPVVVPPEDQVPAE